MFSASEQRVLRTFRQFLMTPGQMLCFSGPELKQYKNTLDALIDKEVLVKEKAKGGYSLTRTGFAAMNNCQ
jgi:predicted transcriptional regulator